MVFSDRQQPPLIITGVMMLTLGTGQAFAQTLTDLPVEAPGALEQLAKPITLENPLPSRLIGGPPIYPGEAMGTGAAGTMVFRLLIDDAGTVAEARYLGHDRFALREVGGRLEAAPMLDSVFLAASENALRAWLYEPPVAAPVAIDVEFAFSGTGQVRTVYQKPADLLQPPPIRIEDAADPTIPSLQVSHPDARAATMAPLARVKGGAPIYPPEAVAQHIEGTVLIEMLIDASGRVADTRLVRGQPQLAPAAIEAVRQWEFAPTLVNGTPTPVIATIVVSFTPPDR